MIKIKTRLVKIYHSLGLAVSASDNKKFSKIFNSIHPRDRADFFFMQKEKVRQKLYKLLSNDELAELFEGATNHNRSTYASEMPEEIASQMLSRIHIDDAVNILRDMSISKANQLLSLIDSDKSAKIIQLWGYLPTSNGSIMTTDFVAVKGYSTIKDALLHIKNVASKASTIYYIYVVNNSNTLVGVLSLRKLLTAKDNELIKDLMQKEPVSVKDYDHKWKASRLIKDYDLIAAPVVNGANRLMGIITVDDIVDSIDEEIIDDYSKMAAITDAKLSLNPFVNLRKRLPWLVILLILGMLTATLIGQFEDTIAKVALLGAFIPVIAGTTGNSGTQALAVVVRSLATGEIKRAKLARYFMSEITTALMTSVLCGIALVSIIYIWKSQLIIGLIAGGALSISIFVGTLAGSIVPLIMNRLKIDPAVASGPLITTICDILSMFVYFSIASAFLSHLL